MDNPFKRSDYAKLCMSPSLDGTLSEYVISQEHNFPLTFNFSWISIVIFIKFIHKCMHIHLSPNTNCIKDEGRYIFMKSKIWKYVCTFPLDRCTVVTSQILEECHLRGQHTQKYETFEKSYLLIGLSKFAPIFAVRF